MDTPESAVRHDEHLIARLRLRDDRPDEPLQIVLDGCAIPQRRRGSRRGWARKVVSGFAVQAHQCTGPALIEYFETAQADHARAPPISHATPLHCAPSDARTGAVNRRVGAVDYQFTGPGYRSDD